MSKEKKLSKDVLSRWLDNLRDFAIRMLGEHPSKEDEPWSKSDDEAVEQLKSLIESSAQEPETAIRITFDSEGNIIGIPYRSQSGEEFRMKVDESGKAILRLNKERVAVDWIQGDPYEALTQKPSEAEVEEFVEKETRHFDPWMYVNADESIKNILFGILREYDKLRRG